MTQNAASTNNIRSRIPVAEPDLSGNEGVYALDAITKEGRISSSGKYIDLFELKCRESFNRAFALSTSNGTTALHLALLALGIGPGDEVIVPSYTFAATAAVVVHCGATPVFVDVDSEEWTLNLDAVKKAYTPKTKAIISVDIYGVPCRYDALEPWCKENNVFLVEDAAEAHGAEYQGRKTGSFGSIGCFSFYGNKILSTGEGGVCVTDDEALFATMNTYKNHGMKKAGTYVHDVVGFNYRLTNVQAAIGCAQFERFQFFLDQRRKLFATYKAMLGSNDKIVFQSAPPDSLIAPWLLSISLKDVNLEQVTKLLRDAGIDTRPFFKPLHTQEAFKKYVTEGQQFPVSDHLYATGISLPTSVLMTEEEIKFVCDSLLTAINT